jgi:type VI secretion system secreted protein VgrG
LAAARQLHIAPGTVRTLSPGTTFSFHGHAQFDGETFAIVRAVHLMHNNLTVDLLGGVIKLLGQGAVAAAGDREFKLHPPTNEGSLRSTSQSTGRKNGRNLRKPANLGRSPYESAGRPS